MAFYYGFFDATLDASTAQYDRTYGADDFTEYFSSFVGSGVCVTGNSDSFRVSYASRSVTIAPGYLFIKGHWLKSDADYSISLALSGNYAVLAKLDTTARTITLAVEERTAGDVYANALVLAYVTVDSSGAATVDDTRYNTDVCGVIDSVGSVNDKLAYALDFIDTKAAAMIAEARAVIDEHIDALDLSLDELEEEVNSIAPPAIGTVRYSAAALDDKWLLCDGSVISEDTYPALAAMLRKDYQTPPAWSVNTVSTSREAISNGFVYNGYIWAYLVTSQKLVGISLTGGAKREIAVTSDSEMFGYLKTYAESHPVCLTIYDGELLIAQANQENSNTSTPDTSPMLTYPDFIGTESSISLGDIFTGSYAEKKPRLYVDSSSMKRYGYTLPYIVKTTYNSSPVYAVCTRGYYRNGNSLDGVDVDLGYLWDNFAEIWERVYHRVPYNGYFIEEMRIGFNRKNGNEFVWPYLYGWGFSNITLPQIRVYSDTKDTYASNSYSNAKFQNVSGYSPWISNTTPIAGPEEIFAGGSIREKDGRYYLYTVSLNRKSMTVSVIEASLGESTDVASVFPDAAVYIESQKMWAFFVGTGVVFTDVLADPDRYGFIRTEEELGLIENFGYMDYDETASSLYIVGRDYLNRTKIATLDMSDWTIPQHGARLPTLSAETIPGYIKALEG